MKETVKIFSFSANEIRYVKKIKASGKINTSQGEMIQSIIRVRVNPSFNMCTSCSGTISKNFNKLVGWIESFIGCEINDFSEKKAEGLLKDAKSNKKETDMTIEEERVLRMKEKEQSEKKESKRRKRKRKKEKENQEKVSKERQKKRDALNTSRRHKIEAENKALEDARQERIKEKEKDISMCKKAIPILLSGGHDLLTERSDLEKIGSMVDIISYIETTTGEKIESEDQTEEIIMNMALSCLLYTSPSPRDQRGSRMPSSA